MSASDRLERRSSGVIVVAEAAGMSVAGVGGRGSGTAVVIGCGRWKDGDSRPSRAPRAGGPSAAALPPAEHAG
ncbi:hypothetical protein C8242_17270, partial [Paracidovorax avenae]